MSYCEEHRLAYKSRFVELVRHCIACKISGPNSAGKQDLPAATIGQE